MGHKIKVHIKSLDYTPRGKSAEYRAGSVQILDAQEAYELEKAGIAIIVEDPYAYVETSPYAPVYLEQEKEEVVEEAADELVLEKEEVVTEANEEKIINEIIESEGHAVQALELEEKKVKTKKGK